FVFSSAGFWRRRAGAWGTRHWLGSLLVLGHDQTQSQRHDEAKHQRGSSFHRQDPPSAGEWGSTGVAIASSAARKTRSDRTTGPDGPPELSCSVVSRSALDGPPHSRGCATWFQRPMTGSSRFLCSKPSTPTLAGRQ